MGLSGMAPVSLITSPRMTLFICWLLQRGPSIRSTLPPLVWIHLEEHCSHEETHACRHHETPWKETDAPCPASYRCWCPLQVFWFGPCHLFQWIQFRDRVKILHCIKNIIRCRTFTKSMSHQFTIINPSVFWIRLCETTGVPLVFLWIGLFDI